MNSPMDKLQVNRCFQISNAALILIWNDWDGGGGEWWVESGLVVVVLWLNPSESMFHNPNFRSHFFFGLQLAAASPAHDRFVTQFFSYRIRVLSLLSFLTLISFQARIMATAPAERPTKFRFVQESMAASKV